MTDRIEKIVGHLQGTCQTLADVCDYMNIKEDDLTQEELEYLDGEIFCCTGCGWWWEISELNDNDGEQVCNTCREED